jgi:hypothetical protein
MPIFPVAKLICDPQGPLARPNLRTTREFCRAFDSQLRVNKIRYSASEDLGRQGEGKRTFAASGQSSLLATRLPGKQAPVLEITGLEMTGSKVTVPEINLPESTPAAEFATSWF